MINNLFLPISSQLLQHKISISFLTVDAKT